MKFRAARLVPVIAVMMLAFAPSASYAQSEASTPYNGTFITHHVGTFGGHKIRYTAAVRSTTLTDEAGRPAVNFVSTEYVREGVTDTTARPVIFAFAGGPSGPSIAYHMRLFGPRQVIEPKEGGGPTLRDNPDALLDIADMVFIDPAETGFSRILPAGKRAYFYSVNGDCASIAQFMDQWLKTHGRENSPRYVAGGSYGSVRTIRIAWDSMKKRPLDGVIMTANSLMLQEEVGVIGIVLPLPSMAMVAVYHGKADRRGRSDAQIADETYKFAINDYLPALSRVQDLSPQQRAAMADKLQAIIGLPAADILAHDLAITRDDFENGLLKAEGRRLNDHYDGRHSVPVTPADAPSPPDANYALFGTYMAKELDVTYPMADYAANAPDTKDWDFRGPDGAPRNDWPGMTRDILAANPKMWIYSANGLYDMQGVFGQARWWLSRTRLPKERITMHEYTGGHALYSDPDTAAQILKDLRRLLTAHA